MSLTFRSQAADAEALRRRIQPTLVAVLAARLLAILEESR